MKIDTVDQLMTALGTRFEAFPPQLRKAARYVMDNQQHVSISSVRQLADDADVKPNSFVRLAKELGFDGYDEFRDCFRSKIKQGQADFPDRVRWLQSMRQTGHMGALYAQMVNDAIANIEQSFATITEIELQEAAKDIWNAKHVYILGVGVNHTNASNFAYLASTGMNDFTAIPRPASTPLDDLARANEDDVLIAITVAPYRNEVVQAVECARAQGLKIITISDSKASPVVMQSDHSFITSIDTSQFFPSSVAIIAVLETLLSFVIAITDEEIVERVEAFHKRRHQIGLYREE